ncbi:hypothetical protein [Mesotoga prima]|uniref:hypothetical protein n=1 Tax=Mesotoga prima TaxID=1184387 RepID=UPI002FD91361
MMGRIGLWELSEKALDETLSKYSKAMTENSVAWVFCKICEEVDNLTIDRHDDMCRTFCPLYPTEWCRNEPLYSRLFKKTRYEKQWITDINNYLWWITTELELMRSDYEKHWSIGF